MLGTLEVLDNGGHPVELRGSKLRTLLAALVLRAGQPVSADRLADLLWGESPPSGSVNVSAGSGFEVARAAWPTYRSKDRDGGYVLAIDPAADRFERSRSSPRPATSILTRDATPKRVTRSATALALWRGPALDDFAFEEFAQSHRTRLEEMRLTAMEDRIDADLAAGRHEAVAAELEGLVREHPLARATVGPTDVGAVPMRPPVRQSACLPACAGSARRRARASIRVPRCASSSGRCSSHDAALAAPATDGRARAAGLSNIHPELSTFIGRERRRRPHRRAARRPAGWSPSPGPVASARPVSPPRSHCTLVGSGATARGWSSSGSRPASERSPPPSIAPFGPRLGHTGGDDAIDWLTTGLATTELLIVLDNCEHVLAEAAPSRRRSLRSCPGVAVLATSREPLGVSGERVRVLRAAGARRCDATVRQPGSRLGQRLRSRR